MDALLAQLSSLGHPPDKPGHWPILGASTRGTGRGFPADRSSPDMPGTPEGRGERSLKEGHGSYVVGTRLVPVFKGCLRLVFPCRKNSNHRVDYF